MRSGSGGDPTARYRGNLGHKQDDESGLIYMRARYYEPGSGRFLSEDPNRKGSNWALYCGNDPINRIDAGGKFWWFWVAMIAMGAIAGMGIYAFSKIVNGEPVTWQGLAISGGLGAVAGVALGFACIAAATAAGVTWNAALAGEALYWAAVGTQITISSSMIQERLLKVYGGAPPKPPTGPAKALLASMGLQALVHFELAEMEQ